MLISWLLLINNTRRWFEMQRRTKLLMPNERRQLRLATNLTRKSSFSFICLKILDILVRLVYLFFHRLNINIYMKRLIHSVTKNLAEHSEKLDDETKKTVQDAIDSAKALDNTASVETLKVLGDFILCFYC